MDEPGALQEPIVDFSQDDTLHLLPCLVRKASRMLCRLRFPWPVSFAFPPDPQPPLSVEANEYVSETILSAVKELSILVPNEYVSEITVGTL